MYERSSSGEVNLETKLRETRLDGLNGWKQNSQQKHNKKIT